MVSESTGRLEKPWEEELDFYFSETRGARLVVTVDLGAAELAPMATHPLRLAARISMQSPRADGLRRRSEADALFDLEDRLVERLGEVLPLLMVGRTVMAGDVTIWWYAPRAAEARLEELAEGLTEVRGGYEVHLSLERDADWRFYTDFLFPDAYNLQVMLNRRRLMTMLEHGDDGSRPRELEHLAYFETEEEAQAVAERLQRAGFDVEIPLLDAQLPVDAELPWALRFCHVDTLSGGRIDEVCMGIIDLVLEGGGIYEGWGTQLFGPE